MCVLTACVCTSARCVLHLDTENEKTKIIMEPEHLPGGPAPKTGPASRITGSTARRCRFQREIGETIDQCT